MERKQPSPAVYTLIVLLDITSQGIMWIKHPFSNQQFDFSKQAFQQIICLYR